MPVFSSEAQFLPNELKFWVGTITASGGNWTAPKFNNAVTLTDSGVGLVTLNLWVDNAHTIPWKAAGGLVAVLPTFITPPGGATEGGWAWTLDADAVTSAGTFRLRINQQSWAAADPVQTFRLMFVTAGRVLT